MELLDQDARRGLLGFLKAHGAGVEPLAVCAGTNPGWVFANDGARPSTALVWSKGNYGFYLTGKVPGGLGPLIRECLIPRLKAHGIGAFEISCVDPSEDAALLGALGAFDVDAWKQMIFRFDGLRSPPQAEHGRVLPIQAALQEEILQNAGFVHTQLLEYWESLDSFDRAGMGFCAIEDGQAVSLCFTGWAAGDVRALSIETLEAYRRRGHGERCAAALVWSCLERGLTPHWECESTNAASWRLAEKIGFLPDREYICYGFRL